MMQQVGNYNEANIDQAGNSGIFPNVAEINQMGDNNFASSSQNGNSNLSVIGQYGSDNSASLNTIGNYNVAGALQFGNGNTVEQDLIGNGLNFLIFQTGNENFINQVQNQQSSIPMQIHQTGNGMRLIIINGGFH
jgi:minor curlin subunit